MKNKKINKYLLFVVAIIWVMVIYKYFFKNSTTSENINSEVIEYQNTYVLPHKKNEQIEMLLQDPFLKNNSFDVVKEEVIDRRITNTLWTNSETSRPIPPVAYYDNFLWPEMVYLGYVKNFKTEKESIVLKVDQKIKKYSYTDLINDEIKIVKIAQDSIVLKAKKEFTTIYRN